jgi:hypothetical protein
MVWIPTNTQTNQKAQTPKIDGAQHSKRVKPFQIRWNEPLGEPQCPYMRRWVLNTPWFAVRLHRWYRSDDKRFFHDHAWPFLTIVLRGSYVDVSPYLDKEGNILGIDEPFELREVLKAGSIRFRAATHRHYVDVPRGGATTLLFSGKPIRNWGFWVDGKFKRPLKYFSKWGHPPCDEQ